MTDARPIPEVEVAEAKRRLQQFAHAPAAEDDASWLGTSLRHPVGLAAGALALGFGLMTVSRVPAGRAALRLAGRAAMTAAKVLIVPAIAKAAAEATGGGASERKQLD